MVYQALLLIAEIQQQWETIWGAELGGDDENSPLYAVWTYRSQDS